MQPLVLITSIIYTPNLPLSYISTRSVFSHEERFEHTKKTIQTIREKIPNAIIFMVECSDFIREHHQYLLEHTDYFLNIYNHPNILSNIYSKSKSLGEGTMTIVALKYILENNIMFDNLIKISGRYWLSDKFDYSIFDSDSIVIKYIEDNRDNVFTALFQLPREVVIQFLLFLENHFQDMEKYIGYENLFANFIKTQEINHIKNITPIGLEGFVSVSNDFYSG
jgi:hypothetical protein